MSKMIPLMFSTVLVDSLMFSFAFSQSYTLKPYVIDRGGVKKITSSGYIMGCSISQSIIGKLSSGNYIAYIGYWTPKIALLRIEETKSLPKIPITFNLGQNYPNPVVSKTIVKYSIAEPSKVEIVLYDVAGRRIAVLVDEFQKVGYYQVNWDISNVSKNSLPNGIYFYQLKAGDFIDTHKMVILR